MARQDKDKGFQEKLKNFFRISKGQGLSRSRSHEYIILTDELEADLKSTSPLTNRVRVIKELLECSKNNRLEAFTIEKIWTLVKDLMVVRPEVSKEVRHLVFGLFTSICRNQFSFSERNCVIRSNFFAFIQSHDFQEDAGPRFEFLKALTENGRDVSYFDEKIGPFLLTCMPSSNNGRVNTKDFMSFLVNVIKFTQSFLDPSVLEGIVQNVCFICCTSSVKEDMAECLNALSAVICYPSLPPASLPTLLGTLCRTVNVEGLSQTSWKTMRDLLGTHFGHSGLLTMCQFMETGDHSEEIAVIRGAVFFVGAVLWGTKLIRSLKYSPSTVLSSFSQALERKHQYVSYEVMMRIQELMRNQADTLQSVSWDLILDIITKVVAYAKPLPGDVPGGDVQSFKLIHCVNDSLDLIQRTIDIGGFAGSKERFYTVVDSSLKFRPDHSVEKLLQYKVCRFLQTTRPGWFSSLIAFAERHYRLETRAGLKAIALSYIASICLANRDTHEEDLIDKVILPYMKSLETENVGVRQQGVKFIIDFLMESSSKKGHDLLHIVEKIVNRPYENADPIHAFSEKEVIDIHTGIQGLIRIFQTKMYHLPSSISITAYKIIVKHLTTHYKKSAILEECYTIRYMIFDCFFKIRANSLFHLGFPKPASGNVIAYSHYLAVDYREGDEGWQSGSDTPPIPASPQPTGTHNQNSTAQPIVTYISLTTACKLVVSSLKKEKDFRVLQLIFKEIPHVMENKALILSKHGNDIDYLANAICVMMLERSVEYPDSLRHRPPSLQRSEFQGYLYPILTALVSYHAQLQNSQQLNIVKCLERGLVSRSAQLCIVALATCTLEMKETMHRLLPEVLIALSKITPRLNIAIPVLEFLSTLIHLPRVFASFVQEQYLSIFAIALPYTNPFKFNQYTVSLAHHVIAMWFLKCRLSFRRGFVSYIMKGLQNNILNPCEAEKRRNAEMLNEDSSSRQRSSSLTEQSSRRGRERPISGTGFGQVSRAPNNLPIQDTKPAVNEGHLAFHQELTETCVDLMARYAFSDSSALPTRFPSTTFLLSGGHSQTWLIDNRIITITTSGCTQKELRDNLCDKCWLLCRKPSPVLSNPGSDVVDGSSSGASNKSNDQNSSVFSASGSSRRRHHSEFVTSISKPEDSRDIVDAGGTKAKDDLHLELEHKLQPGRKLSFSAEEENNDWAPKHKSDHMLCTCWCQGWAEIHIRRPTGNTSWMMRIQNQIGNNGGVELPMRELSAMYLRNPELVNPQTTSPNLSPNYTPPAPSTGASSTAGSPSHRNNIADAVGRTQSFTAANLENPSVPSGSKSSSSPSSPKSPTARSPTEERKSMRIENVKQVVHRSNSSPEMEGWKHPFVNQQYQIEEQDEEDTKPDEVFSIQEAPASSNSNASKNSVHNSHMVKGGTTSPYRGSYEAIPEEILNKDSVVMPSSPGRSDKPIFQSQHSVEEPPKPVLNETETQGLTPLKRDRVNTVSVMSGPLAARNSVGIRRNLSTGSGDVGMRMNRREYDNRSGNNESTSIRSGLSPGFVFLQLCTQGMLGKDVKPLLVNSSHEKSIKVFDYIPPYETHKIGVVYVGPGQSGNEGLILQNMCGSVRYRDFLQGLGKLIKLREVDPQKTFLGGLSRDGDDGEFAYIWQDDVMQVMFHVPTLMPNKPSDPNFNSKKRHIGNDYVAIVYNNTNDEYDIGTIKGQFLYACVVIQPLDHGTNRIVVKAKPVLAEQIGHTESKIVSDRNLPTMARQLALHSNLASMIFESNQRPEAGPYASNWLERLRKIKLLRSRLESEIGGTRGGSSNSPDLNASSKQKQPFNVVDFTEFV